MCVYMYILLVFATSTNEVPRLNSQKTHDTYQTCEHDQKYYQKTVQPYKISSVKPKGLAGDGVCEGQKF